MKGWRTVMVDSMAPHSISRPATNGSPGGEIPVKGKNCASLIAVLTAAYPWVLVPGKNLGQTLPASTTNIITITHSSIISFSKTGYPEMFFYSILNCSAIAVIRIFAF